MLKKGARCSPKPRIRCSTLPKRCSEPRRVRLSSRRKDPTRPMSILIDKDTRLVVQGLTGREGSFHAKRNRDYGTNLVAGVTPGKGGTDVDGVPIFDTVDGAVSATGANAAMVFVPARFAADAVLEAHEAGIDGIIPGEICTPGPVGLVSRSGTLTYQIVHELTQRGIGQSTCVGIGGDPIPGSDFIDVLAKFEADVETELVVLVGEIGGDAEERAAAWAKENMTKPVVAYIAGFTAPPGKRMGHAGAIISGSRGTAQAKADALEAVGIRVGRNPTEVGEIVAEIRGAT